MTRLDLAHHRLHNQHLIEPTLQQPSDVVTWLGAVQAQDYAAAKWAVAQRMTTGITDASLDRAFAAGTLLRTHVLRPTWHFVTPADIRWMLALTAPRVNAANAYQYRNLALDDAVFKRSHAALTKALQGGGQLTRAQLGVVLQRAGIALDNLRLTHLMMRAELDRIICSGARQGKQFTYALLDERVPPTTVLERDEALMELTRRYFTSHGPATAQDFVWWSGLTMADAQAGLVMIKSQLAHEVLDGKTYWYAASMRAAQSSARTAHLLPNYDEYIVGYQDRSAAVDAGRTPQVDARGNVLFNHTIMLDGRVVGTWKRTLAKTAVVVELKPFAPLTKADQRAVAAAVQRYGAFLDLPVTLA
jgi:hypothetical protein